MSSVAIRAQRAVYVAFIGSGFGFASWASRIPQIRDTLQATPSELGLILLAIAVGAVIALPLAGLVVNRFGPARTVAVLASVLSVGMVVLALGTPVGAVPVVIGLFLIGYGNGTWDVAMNVEGAAVEQQLGRTIMPRFHAGFSIVTVLGALGGVACVALDISVTAHLLTVAVINAAIVPMVALRGFMPRTSEPEANADVPAENAPHPLRAWREPRTLVIGMFGLCMAFSEGVGNDWLAVAVIDGYGAAPVVGPLTFAIFLAAMTAGRWFGPTLIDRRGRVFAVRLSALVALVGLVLVVFGTLLPVAMVGAVLWGAGTALGFPVGMSAAADDPVMSAARVSVVASIAYTAFLAGPPFIGLLGDHLGVLRALSTVAGLLAVALLLGGVTRPLNDARPERDDAALGPSAAP
ncbi:MAG TPA: MFS transporter [Propionibacteriaceae bacterium]|nr:MFS transporter [Propionibacteriaceae bacterium]